MSFFQEKLATPPRRPPDNTLFIANAEFLTDKNSYLCNSYFEMTTYDNQ